MKKVSAGGLNRPTNTIIIANSAVMSVIVSVVVNRIPGKSIGRSTQGRQ